jgi:hypothetical protein
MLVEHYTRTSGRCLTYDITYDAGEYFIERDGVLKKRVDNPAVATVATAEATPELMRQMAIADIEALIGMDE